MANDIGAQQNYQRSMLDAINTVVQRRIDGLKLDKTVVGIIDKNIGIINGYPIYQVKYEGGVFTATARDSSESYARNTAVYVMVPQSDFSKEKFIIGKASSISTNSVESVAISAAINNYVKLGPNLIKNSSLVGLRSYHDPKEETIDPNSILHRARFLYSTNQEIATSQSIDVMQNLFKTYAQDATNILLKADFRTILDVSQQRSAAGRYGLAVTLTFTNPNAGYGETQGEILDNLGAKIIGDTPKLSIEGSAIDVRTNTSISAQGWVGDTNNSIDNTSLKEWDNKLQLFLNSKDADDDKVRIWQQDGTGLFDCYSQYIQTMYQTFCVNNAEFQSNMTDNLVAAYLNLLKDLKNAEQSLNKIKEIYNSWKTTSIGDTSDVDEIIYLTSDMMLGNPFSFNSWNTQYVIPSQSYDFSRFKEIKNIVFFKEGFQENVEKELIWPPSDAPKDGGSGWDILCQNIQLFLLKDLDSEYQGLSLKVECSDGYDGVLKTLSAKEKTSFNAHVYRNQTEELTGNANIQYVWLKQSAQVINASHADYYHYAGVGWKRLRNTTRYSFQTTGNENWAYKNLYKCIALYQSGVETIPLSTTFVVYNEAISTKIKLESDLGTNFTFSEGSPTITCLIQEESLPGKTGEEAENYQECTYLEIDGNPLYKYQWSIADSANGSVLFLEEALAQNTSNILKENILSNIKMWYLNENRELIETNNPTKATRIQYPVSLSSAGFTVQCDVQKNFILNTQNNYCDVGSDSIEITNLKMASSSSYRIIIENGDQVFQYDVYGNAPTETKFKDPLEIKPLRAKIVGPTGLEFSGENVNIEWIFNLEDTMIIPPENLVLNPATQQEQIKKGAECSFGIEKLYNPNAQNNQITCHAHFNDTDIYTDTNFYFSKVGSNGTNGTDVVSKIKYEGSDKYFVLHNQPLTILYSQKNKKSMLNVSDIIIDDNDDTAGNKIQLTPDILNVHLYQKGEEIESVNFEQGYPRWNLAGNVNGTTNNTGKYFEIEEGNIVWDPNHNDDNRSLLLQNIRSEVKVKESQQNYYSFFSLPIIKYEEDIPDLPMNRIAIDKNSYLNDIVYNADGRNPIYNHNQGLKLINLPENSMVYWEARGGLNSIKSERTNIVQEYFETEPSVSLGFEKDTEKTFSKLIVQRQSDIDKKEEVYNEERKEASKKYYYEDENGEIQGTSLYQLYIKQYNQENQDILAEFKSERLRILQKDAIRKFIEEYTIDGSENEIDEEGNVLKWSRTFIRNGQREDLPLEECWWFSRNVNLWWDSEAVLENLFLDSESTIPVLIWDENRYQLPDFNEENENVKYTTYYNEENNFINVDSIDPDDKDYKYEKIYCPNIEPPMTPKEYFDSIYPEYKEEQTENIQVLENDITESMIYILPDDIYDGSVTNNRIEAKIYTKDLDNDEFNLYATVYAPINMTLDTFGLDSVNAWDGNSVTIDEERGAVLAPQIGAGEKDSNNRFTGILMGKTNTYTGQASLEEQVGLFGYSYGIQSIFLDAKTGNADFGLPSGNSIQLDKNGNYIGLKNDDYNEGRIELRPGGVSKIGGWRLGHRSLYYTQSGEIGPRYKNDYVPNIKTGKIEYISSEPYSGHHEKDIDYKDSGILLHSGNDPYISIKGRRFTEDDIDPADLNNYLRPDDSLEIQLDPKAPTLFTVFRHNGSDWNKHYLDENGTIQTATLYKEGTRTYLAGINGKGEFVANTVSSIVQTDDKPGSIYTTQFSVNSFRAFDDIENEGIEIPEHTGLRVKIGEYTLGQMFISNTGLNPNINNNEHDPTLYITGGLADEGEYTRPISLHGKYINLFAQDSMSQNDFFKTTDANLILQTNSFETSVGQSTFKLFRDLNNDISSNLMSANNLKINAGIEFNGEPIEYYSYYLDDSHIDIAKINKRNVSDVYISWEDKNDISKKHYALYGSWIGNEIYIKNPNSNDSDLFININNYPRCYRVTGRNSEEYCTEEDFQNIFYQIKNRPEDANTEDYILEDVLKENRCILENNRYTLIDSTVDFNVNQFFRVEKIINDDVVLDQSYVYINKTNLNQNILYSKYIYNNTLYYVFRSDDFIYCKIDNNYDLKSSLNAVEPKIKVLNEGYYNNQDIDLDTIYYQYNEDDNIFYAPSSVLSKLYIKEILTNEQPIAWDEDENPTAFETESIESYHLYNEENDNNENIFYFFYQDDYFSVNNLNQNVEYVYILTDKKYVLKDNLTLNVYVYKNKEYNYETFTSIYNKNYYKVSTYNNGREFYISEDEFNNLIFNYWYCSSKIDGSNYVLSSNILSDNLYKRTEENLYVIDNDAGIYYRTNILDANKENTYVYISLNPNQNISIDYTKKYYYNRLDTLNPWKLYTSDNKLITNDLDKQSDILYEYRENEPYYLYYFSNNEAHFKDFAQLTEFYAVSDIENNLFYIEKNYLDNYAENNSLYLYINGFKEIIKDETQEIDQIIESASNKKYELYAGEYFGKITTNSQSNRYTNLEINNTGINFFNSSGPINLISEDSIFNFRIKKNVDNVEKIGGEISFGANSAKFKDDFILGKFIIDNAENGLILTDTWLRLKSKKNTLIESPNSVNIISETQGNGNVYNGRGQSQIVLRAGSKDYITPGVTTTVEGSKAELILNSSNNGWASVIKGKSFTSRLSYPVFKVGTTYSSIGIYPEIFNSGGQTLYRENFYVAMPQYNSAGLKVDGHTPSAESDYGLNVTKGGYFGGKITTNTGFYGNGKGISKTCDHGDGTVKASGGSIGTTLGNSISISIPNVSIKNGRPNFSTSSISLKYNMPSADDVGADRAGSAAAALAAAKQYAKDLFNQIDLSKYLKKDTRYTGHWSDTFHLSGVTGGKETKAHGERSSNVVPYTVHFS